MTWDNIASWVQQKLVSYTVCVTEQEPKDVIQTSTLAFGRNVVRQLRKLTPGGGSELPPPEPQEVAVAAGTMGMVSKDVTEGHSLELVFEVSKGSDVDFMMALLPLGADGKADEQAEGTRLYGPTRRSDPARASRVSSTRAARIRRVPVEFPRRAPRRPLRRGAVEEASSTSEK